MRSSASRDERTETASVSGGLTPRYRSGGGAAAVGEEAVDDRGIVGDGHFGAHQAGRPEGIARCLEARQDSRGNAGIEMRVHAERGADIPRMRIEIGRGQAQAIIEQSSSGSEVVVAGADVVVVAVVVVLVSGGSAASVLSSSAHPAASGTRATNTTVHTRHLIARHGRTVGEGATPPGRLPGMAASDLPATADLCDDHDDEVAILDNVFRSLGGRDQMAGTAVTLKLFEDNSLVREAVAEDGVGKVLVVDAGGSRRRAVVGDQP